MRLNDYLTEATYPEASLEDIKTNCRSFLSEIKSSRNILMRFSNNYAFNTIVHYKLKKDRKPVDTPQAFHEMMNDDLKSKFGWYPRSNGLFTWLITKPRLKNLPPLAMSRKPVLVFPIGSYKYVYNPQIEDIYMEWDAYYQDKQSEYYSERRGKDKGKFEKDFYEANLFKDWWEEFALPDYTNKNALNAHIYPFRVECMINAKAFYLIPKNLWEPTFYELGIKI